MTTGENGKSANCPLPPRFTTIETFDHIDLLKICEFFQKYARKRCEIIHEWFSADLGILRNRASLCVDEDADAVFIYKGPRTKDSPMIICLGKTAKVEFIKGEEFDREPWYFIEITDESGVVARFSATSCQVFSSVYPTRE